MNIKKLVLLLLVSAVMLLPAVGCGGGKEYDAIELVPEGADMIVGIQLSEAISKWDLYSEVEEETEMSQQFEGAMDDFVGEMGVDPRDISDMVLFGDMSSMETDEYMGFIIAGDFGKGSLIGDIEKGSGMEFTTSKYGDYTLYTDQQGQGAVVIINSKMIIIGSVAAVKDCIDVAGGKVERVSGTVLTTYNELGDSMLRLAMVIPEEDRGSLTEETAGAPMPLATEAFADMETLGLAVDQGADVMTIEANLSFGGAQSAEDAADAISGMIDMFGVMSPERETKDLLDKMEIRASGSRVYVSFEISLSELEEMAGSFVPDMSSFTEPPEMPEFD
ncbi:hypothetical protein ACFLVU_01940 [Chloroflexota bacterium]